MNVDERERLAVNIKRYLDGEMTPPEQESFLSSIKGNQEATQMLREALYTLEIDEIILQQSLKKKLQEANRGTSPNGAGKLRYWWILVFLLIVISAYYTGRKFLHNGSTSPIEHQELPKPTNEQPALPEVKTNNDKGDSFTTAKSNESPGRIAFEKMYTPPLFAAIVLRGEDSSMQFTETYNKAIAAFTQQKYREAYTLISNLENSSEIPTNLEYLEAHCLLKLNKLDLASKKFQKVTADEYFERHDEARWYLLLTYVALDKTDKALTLQREIQDDKYSEYQDDSKKLMQLIPKK
jgi:hypothetical protein